MEENQAEEQPPVVDQTTQSLRDGQSEPQMATTQEPAMQVSIGTKGNQESNMVDIEIKNNKSSSSGPGTASSNLNVYLRHNPPSRAGRNLEPVKLATTTGLQQIMQLQEDKAKAVAASQTMEESRKSFQSRAKNENRISQVLNQEEFQHLGQLSSQEQQQQNSPGHSDKQSNKKGRESPSINMVRTGSPQKMYLQNTTNNNNQSERQQDNGQVHLQVTGQAASQNFALPQYGIIDPSKQIVVPADVQNMQQLMNNIKDPNQLAKIMKDLAPANGQKLISPPVGMIFQSEDQQLFELYQMQSQELMRIANEGLAQATPPMQITQTPGQNSDGETHTPTQEQAQQIAMPELKFNDDPLFTESMRLNDRNAMTFGMVGGPGKASMTQHEHHEILEPKLRSQKEIVGRFIDQPSMSQQTISVPEMTGIEKSNQVNQQPSLQKITLPAFHGANYGKPAASQVDEESQQTGTFKDKLTNAIFSSVGGAYQRKDQVILGMMDSGEELSADSPGVIRGPPTLSSGQQVQWVRVPRPQQPNLVEKNAIGGGGKYTGSSRTSNNAVTVGGERTSERANQPTFPAFFTKSAKNQQKKTSEQQLTGGSLTQMKQMISPKKTNENKDGRLTSNDILHVIDSKNGGVTLVHQSDSLSARKMQKKKPRRNTTIEPKRSITNQEEAASKNFAEFRPIRVQSVLAPYPEASDETLQTNSFMPMIERASQQQMRHPSNYKVSYLNRPSAVLNQTSSATSTKFAAASPQRGYQQTLAPAQGNMPSPPDTSGKIVNAAAYGAAINQDSKMSFKDYIELQNFQQMEQKFNQPSVEDQRNLNAYNRQQLHSQHTASHDSPQSSARRNIDSRHPSLNANFVPRLQTMKPKRALESVGGQAINLNEDNSMSKLRRMTMEESKFKPGVGRNRSLMNRTVNQVTADDNKIKNFQAKPQRLSSLNRTSRSNFMPKNASKTSSLPKQRIDEHQMRQNEAMMARGINTFVGRTSPYYGPDSNLEVVVLKQPVPNENQGSVQNLNQASVAQQQASKQLELQQQNQREAVNNPQQLTQAQQEQQTMHFGGKFQVNIHKRSSTNTITESQSILNNHTQSKEVLLRKKSQLSTVTAQAPVITPKYFATIQAITANERKQLMMVKKDSVQQRGSSPTAGADVNTALQRSFADDTTYSVVGGLAKNSSDTHRTPMEQYQMQMQTPSKQMYQTQYQISAMSKETQPPSPGKNNMKTLMSITANQKTFRRENAAGSLGSNLSNHSQSPWHRKKNKVGQPPMMTAEHIVQQNISPYERQSSPSKQRNYDQTKLQQANAQGIVLGLPKKLSDVGGARNSLKENSHFLPELSQKRNSGLNVLGGAGQEANDKAPGQVDIQLKTMDPKADRLVMNADLLEKVNNGQEEIDSILSPEYLRLVNNQSELRGGAEALDGTTPTAGENSGNNQKQERRQVIKILDQSKWRQNAAQPGIEQQNSFTNMNEAHLLPITPILGGGKTHTASTADQKKRKTADANKSSTNKASSKQNSKRQDLTQVLQEGSLHMGSVFDHHNHHADSRMSISKAGGSGPNSTFQKGKGRKSHMTYNQDLKIQGKGTTSNWQPSNNMMQDQIEESEREMKELIARENLMQDDMGGTSSIDHPNFDTNVPVGISAIFSQDQDPTTNFMSQTEYSQFIKNNDVAEQGNQTKQDFNGQIQAEDYDHLLYQTMGNLQNINASSGQIEMTTIPERMNQTKNQGGKKRFFSLNNKKVVQMPNQNNERQKHPLLKLSPRKKQGANETVPVYPVGVHARNSMLHPIDKLKTQLQVQKQIAMQNRLNPNFLDSQKMLGTNHHRNSSINSTGVIPETTADGGSIRDISRNVAAKAAVSMMSLTQTRFSQHQRALSELRSIQRQIHLDGQEQSPPMPRASPRGFQGSKKESQDAVTAALSVKRQLAKERTVSPRKLKQIAEREQRLEKLKQAEAQKNADAAANVAGGDEVRTIEAKSERDLASTQMGKRTPDDTQTVVAQPADRPQQQAVIVNTSGANTAFLPTPQNMGSPRETGTTHFQPVSRALEPPYAVQMNKCFAPKIFEKSVLPEGRSYHYNTRGGLGHSKEGVNKDIIDAVPPGEDYAHERAGSSIIANYKQQSQLDADQDASPKSYKMPANFPHGVDSQAESVGGGPPDSASAGRHITVSGAVVQDGVGKRDRMPVHSFTTAQQEILGRHHDRAYHKIQSSKVNHRRHILAEKKTTNTVSKLQENFIGEVVRGESIELAQTLRMKQQTKQDVTAGDVLPLSFEDSADPMPERYEVENDSIQNIIQVQDLLDVVEKEKEQNKKAGLETVNNSSQNGNEVGQGSIDFEVIQANIAAAAAIDPSERETPDMTKSAMERVAQIEKSMLLSSAQTLEAEQLTSPPDQHRNDRLMVENAQ